MRYALRFAIAAAVALGVDGACSHHDATPVVAPDEHPPLPAGTPIAYLIDDATELKLRDDQLSQLRTIDSDLAGKLDVLDATPHAANAAPAGAQQGTGRRRGGGAGGGGRRGGGGGGGRRGGGAGAGSGSGAPRPPAAPTASAADDANRRAEQRSSEVRDALGRAFALLDPGQQVIARRVLEDKGVDLDPPRAGAGSAAAESGDDSDADSDTGSGSN